MTAHEPDEPVWDDEDLLPPLHSRDRRADDDRDATTRLERWRKSTASGAIATAIAMGLREVFEPPKDDEIVEVVDASGDDNSDRLELHFDPDDPRGSSVVVRRPRP